MSTNHFSSTRRSQNQQNCIPFSRDLTLTSPIFIMAKLREAPTSRVNISDRESLRRSNISRSSPTLFASRSQRRDRRNHRRERVFRQYAPIQAQMHAKRYRSRSEHTSSPQKDSTSKGMASPVRRMANDTYSDSRLQLLRLARRRHQKNQGPIRDRHPLRFSII